MKKDIICKDKKEAIAMVIGLMMAWDIDYSDLQGII